MPLMNTRELRQMVRTLGADGAAQNIIESLQATCDGEPNHLTPADFSIRQLAEGVVEDGYEWVQSMMESSAGVSTTAFSNITGQLLINEIMSEYQSPAYMISQAFRTISTSLDGEKIPGIAKIGDQTEEVKEGMPYPHVGFGEDFVETPSTIKNGLIVPVTKEAVFFDKTGILLENARQVGESIAIDKEKRCVDLLIGATNNHSWKGTSYNTYQASTPWINLLTGASNDLVDWTQLEIAELLFADMTDPNTGEPISIMPDVLIGSPSKRHTFNRVLNATEIRYTDTSAKTETLAANPVGSSYRSMTSQYVYSRLKNSSLGLSTANAKATWFFGEIQKAFVYMENWPITVTQAPQNSEAEFNQDIIARFKASERGVPFAKNPRFMVKVSGHA